jgi:hypothetical protein
MLVAAHTATSLPNSSRGDPKMCDIAQLDGTAALQGATGSMLGGIEIHNSSGQACRLPDRPTLRLLSNKHLLASHQTPWLKWSSVGISHVHVRVLAPGTSAFVIVQWNGCARWRPPTGFSIRATFELSFRGSSGTLLVPLADRIAEPCAFPGQPSALSVSYFIPSP